MKQITFSFPQIINRTSKKTEMSTNTKSINECLGILLRTRPRRIIRRSRIWMSFNRKGIYV